MTQSHIFEFMNQQQNLAHNWKQPLLVTTGLWGGSAFQSPLPKPIPPSPAAIPTRRDPQQRRTSPSIQVLRLHKDEPFVPEQVLDSLKRTEPLGPVHTEVRTEDAAVPRQQSWRTKLTSSLAVLNTIALLLIYAANNEGCPLPLLHPLKPQLQ